MLSLPDLLQQAESGMEDALFRVARLGMLHGVLRRSLELYKGADKAESSALALQLLRSLIKHRQLGDLGYAEAPDLTHREEADRVESHTPDDRPIPDNRVTEDDLAILRKLQEEAAEADQWAKERPENVTAPTDEEMYKQEHPELGPYSTTGFGPGPLPDIPSGLQSPGNI